MARDNHVKNPERNEMEETKIFDDPYPLFKEAVRRAVFEKDRVAIYWNEEDGYFIGWYYGGNTFTPGDTTIRVFDPFDWRFTDWAELYIYVDDNGNSYVDTDEMAADDYWEWQQQQYD